MVRVIGIDPGTKSFDFCGLEDDKIILDISVSTKDIMRDPDLISNIIMDSNIDLAVGPSGFGIPVKRIEDIGEKDMFLMSLIRKCDKKSVLGMRNSIARMKEHRLPVFFIPGVIHLQTVPDYRKFNKIDMGTADKLCCTALGIRDQAKRHRKNYDRTSFIMLEMGYGYTAAIAVYNGKIVDGIGGSSGNIGFLSMGCMDAELAYLLDGFDKELIFKGGVATLARDPEELVNNETAKNAYIEGAVKNILSLTASVKPEEILVSGRISKVSGVLQELKKRLDMAPVRKVDGFHTKNVKEAAEGAALIANGLAGGKYEPLIDVMELKKARGTSLDHILLPEIAAIKKEYLQ
ncbi:MAG: DUF1464 family protein [Candidatus Methanoperedens sp.]|nr:DUF1464 family protein [Candidatus Methanoperedens sp.]